MLKRYSDWSELIKEVVDEANPDDEIIKFTWPGNLTFGIENFTQQKIYSIGVNKFKSQNGAFKNALATTTWLDIYSNESVMKSDYELFIKNAIKNKGTK